MNKTLGIIGGMGAAAGVRMAQYVVEYYQHHRANKDSDFPEFILHSYPIEGMSERGIDDPAKVERQLVKAVQKLNLWGCDYLLVACNTVHCFADKLTQEFGGDVINIIELAAETVMGHRTVGVLCSETTKRLGLYERAIRGPKVIASTDAEQAILNAAIAAVISGSEPPLISSIIDNMRERGAEMVVVGCTELPLCLPPPRVCAVSWLDAGKHAAWHAASLLK